MEPATAIIAKLIIRAWRQFAVLRQENTTPPKAGKTELARALSELRIGVSKRVWRRCGNNRQTAVSASAARLECSDVTALGKLLLLECLQKFGELSAKEDRWKPPIFFPGL